MYEYLRPNKHKIWLGHFHVRHSQNSCELMTQHYHEVGIKTLQFLIVSVTNSENIRDCMWVYMQYIRLSRWLVTVDLFSCPEFCGLHSCDWCCFVLPFYFLFYIIRMFRQLLLWLLHAYLAICPSLESATKPDMSIHSRTTYLSIMRPTKRLKFAETLCPLYGVYLFTVFHDAFNYNDYVE
jgi:hypothetical protein